MQGFFIKKKKNHFRSGACIVSEVAEMLRVEQTASSTTEACQEEEVLKPNSLSLLFWLLLYLFVFCSLFKALKSTKFFQATHLDWVEAGLQVRYIRYIRFVKICKVLKFFQRSVVKATTCSICSFIARISLICISISTSISNLWK